MATLADFYKRPGVEFQFPGATFKMRFVKVDRNMFLERYWANQGGWDRDNPESYPYWDFICRDDFEEIVSTPVADHYVVFVQDEDGREYAYKYDTKGQARLGAYAASMQDGIMKVGDPIPVVNK